MSYKTGRLGPSTNLAQMRADGKCADTHVREGDKCVKIPEAGDECGGADDGFAYAYDDTMACAKTDSCLSFYTRTAEGTCKRKV